MNADPSVLTFDASRQVQDLRQAHGRIAAALRTAECAMWGDLP